MKLPPADQLEGTYVWPQTLRRPKPPPKLVYLDLNDWIALAKALAGHRDGQTHKDTLSACTSAVDEGSAVFPISDTIYFEISKIGRYRQRRDLREVIEKVSRYMVVTSRSVISVHERGAAESLGWRRWGSASLHPIRRVHLAGVTANPDASLGHPAGAQPRRPLGQLSLPFPDPRSRLEVRGRLR
jgi:hypothetical protein